MALISESGHAKNISSFGSLLVSIEVLGSAYSPFKEDLKLNNLKVLHAQAKSTVQGVALAMRVYSGAIEAREKAWDGIDLLVKRVLNLKEIFAEDELADKISLLVKKIEGRETLVAEQAAAGQSIRFNILAAPHPFDSRLDSFEQLVKIISANSLCTTKNDTRVSESLQALLSNLKTKNISIKLAESALNTARANRDNLLYQPNTGLVDIAREVKAHIEEVFTEENPQYTQILSTEFWNQ